MSRPKHLNSYPTWLIELLAAFEADGRERVMRCASPKAALALRLDIYGFKGAVRAEGADTWPNVLCARMRVKGATLTLFHADDIPTPKITVK